MMAMDRSGNNRPGLMLTSGSVVPLHPPECRPGTGRAREATRDLSLLLWALGPLPARKRQLLVLPRLRGKDAGAGLARHHGSLPFSGWRTAEHAEFCDSVQTAYGIPLRPSAGPAQHPHMRKEHTLTRPWSCGDPWPTLGLSPVQLRTAGASSPCPQATNSSRQASIPCS